MTLSGRCPTGVASIFFGGKLLALNKKSGDLLRIVIGFALRRLVSKCANSFGKRQLEQYLCPLQLGVGAQGGCEAAIHSARRYLQAMPSDFVLAKLDFSNAFNSLHRKDMLLATLDRLPELYAYILSAYSAPSNLFFGSHRLASNEGPQQGDPLGPLLFCLTIHPLLLSLESELILGYLDDLTVAGNLDTVAKDISRIQSQGQAMGLTLNINKCELIADSGTSVTDALLASFTRIPPEEASLLGAPLFQGQTLDVEWGKRCDELGKASDRLHLVGSQSAIILLRSSFGAPRVQHLLRCSPSHDHVSLVSFDNLLRSTLNNIVNANLSDAQWTQASLPIRDGGLGVRRISVLALPAFLASNESTRCLQDAILSKRPCSPDKNVLLCQTFWSQLHGPQPAGSAASKQSAWDRPGILADRAMIELSLNNPRQKALFLAAEATHSGDWLHALPIPACGLALDDEAIRVAVAMRLGLDVCAAHPCRCGADVDVWGTHSFICKRAQGRIIRHQVLNDIIARAFVSAGVPITKEPQGLARSNGKRPDGLTLIPWSGGKAVSWDVTVATTCAASYIQSSATIAGAAAETAASKKLAKYSDLAVSHRFLPIALESQGPINTAAETFLKDLGRRISLVSGDPRESTFLFQRLSVALQRFNSILLHQSFVVDEALDI